MEVVGGGTVGNGAAVESEESIVSGDTVFWEAGGGSITFSLGFFAADWEFCKKCPLINDLKNRITGAVSFLKLYRSNKEKHQNKKVKIDYQFPNGSMTHRTRTFCALLALTAEQK